MHVELIEPTTADLHVVNAARVSFDKESTQFTYRKDMPKGSDEGLLNYLAKNDHFTPFTHFRFTLSLDLGFILGCSQEDLAGAVWEHLYGTKGNFRTSLQGWANLVMSNMLPPGDRQRVLETMMGLAPNCAAALLPQSVIGGITRRGNWSVPTDRNPYFTDITLRETVPIFVARQRFKHTVGFTYNEVSRRYVDDTPTVFSPGAWRSRPDTSIKQGSGETTIDLVTVDGQQYPPQDFYEDIVDHSLDVYNNMIADGVAPEQARMLLPQSMYTSYYVTGHLAAWRRAYKLRADSHAQKEIQDLAAMWADTFKAIPGEPIYLEGIDRDS